MIVVNFYAGPGAGKSTLAALLFSELKLREMNVELVTEFAKDLTWDESFKQLSDQIFVFANQLHKLNRVKGKVDIAIVDSPLPLSFIYGTAGYLDLDSAFGSLIMEQYNSFNNLNFLVKRKKKYIQSGRSQNVEEANVLDLEVEYLLSNKLKLPYTEIPGNRYGLDIVLKALGIS